jgi:hypothetical protein
MYEDDEDAAAEPAAFNGYYPVLQKFAASKIRARTLSTLRDLCFLSGRAFDHHADWEADAKTALAKAFPGLTPERQGEWFEVLLSAYYAGKEQWVIDNRVPSPRALRLARTLAVAHVEDLLARASVDATASWIAYRLGRSLGVHPAPAARASIDALGEFGFRTSLMAGERIMDSARAGWRRSAAGVSFYAFANGAAA